MRKILFALLFLLTACGAHAKEYGNYDPRQLLTTSETPSWPKHSFNGAYLDQILNDLSSQAKNYPPRFDTPQDQQRAMRDVKIMSGMLDILLNGPNPNSELLLRAADLNSMGHNLDIAGSAEKANALYQKLLAAASADPRGNYKYGVFLGGIDKAKEALPYLQTPPAARFS